MTVRQQLKSRNNAYYSAFPAITASEIKRRSDVATEIELLLIALLNYMGEYRNSVNDFLTNYGDFSDRLNVIYNTAEQGVFENGFTALSAMFSQIQRQDFQKMLPVTLDRLKKYRDMEDGIILAAWLFSPERAEKAARNTVNSLFSCEKLDSLKRQGFKSKQWHTIMDGRERATHAAVNNRIVPVDEFYIVGGYRMMFPRDTTYGAPAKEVMNCRCMLTGR